MDSTLNFIIMTSTNQHEQTNLTSFDSPITNTRGTNGQYKE